MPGDDEVHYERWATVEALRAVDIKVKAVDEKVDGVAGDVKEVRGWLEGSVTNSGLRSPGLIDTVTGLKHDSHSAKWLLRLILGALVAAVVSDWVFYLTPHGAFHGFHVP